MKAPIISLALAIAVALTAGCASRQQAGAVTGAGVGAAAGGAVTGDAVGMLLGAVVGAAIGSEIGRELDEYDRRQAALILERNRSYETSHWRNPDTGRDYRVTPEETFYRAEDQPCREFRMEAEVDGQWEDVYGTACRQPDGSWEVVST
jgi:surface antigen